MRCLGLIACAAALLAFPVPALAEEIVTRVTVPTRDLDLTRAEGIKTLKGRVSRAVRRACGTNGRSLHERIHERSCIRDSSRRAAIAVERSIATSLTQSWSSTVPRRTTPVR